VAAGVVAYSGHKDSVVSLAAEQSSALLISGSDDCTARVWDTNRGRTARCLTGFTGSVNALATLNANVVFCASNNEIRAFDLRDSRVVVDEFQFSLGENTDEVTKVCTASMFTA